MFLKRLEWLLVKNPELHCEKCFEVYKRSELKPLCKNGKGCPIEDVAPLVYINKRVNKFRQYKILSETNTPEPLLLEILDQVGLKDDINTLIQAEVFYAQGRNKELSKKQKK